MLVHELVATMATKRCWRVSRVSLLSTATSYYTLTFHFNIIFFYCAGILFANLYQWEWLTERTWTVSFELIFMELKIVSIHFQRPLSMLRHGMRALAISYNLHCFANCDTVRCNLFIRGLFLFEAFLFSNEASCSFIPPSDGPMQRMSCFLVVCVHETGAFFVSILREDTERAKFNNKLNKNPELLGTSTGVQRGKYL